MEDLRIKMNSLSDGQGQEGSGVPKSLEGGGGASPDTEEQATPLSQHFSDTKPLIDGPSVDQACYLYGVVTVPLCFFS